MQTMTIASCCVGLTLPGMIEEPGSFSGNSSSRKTAARTGSQPAHVVGNLHQRDGESAHRRHCRDHRIERALRGEFIGRRNKRIAGQLRDLRGDVAAEIRRCVEPGTDCGAARRQFE